jgi:hypothetical protein
MVPHSYDSKVNGNIINIVLLHPIDPCEKIVHIPHRVEIHMDNS